ncbi:MAG: DUF6290 family protein [Lachnospiraceae bacterium]
MARTGRPKTEEPANKRVTVRFKENEYDLLLEYAENHNMTIAQVIRFAVETQVLSNHK